MAFPESSGAISGLVLECDRQAEKPPLINGEPDKYISMFAVALKSCLDDPEEDFSEAKELISWTVEKKKQNWHFPSSYVFNHIMRSVQAFSMNSAAYPYETQEEWDERVFRVMSDEEEFKKITYNMLIWNVGSDVETRAAGPKLVAHTMQNDRVNNPEDPYTMLNVGSARDHTLAMLKGNVQFPEVSVTNEGLNKDQQKFLQKIVNKLLAKDIGLGYSCGVDLWPLRDPDWSEYLEACRFYPSELHDSVKRYMYRYLEELRDANPDIDHVDGYYGDRDFDFGRRFDLVAFITSLYQNRRDKRRAMFDRALVDVKDNGLIMIQDFCEIDETANVDNPIDKLKFLGPTSKPFSYGVFVYDTKNPDSGLKSVGYFNNGRCEVFRPSEYFIDMLRKQNIT